MTDFDNKTMKELKSYCRDNNIRGFSTKKKADLIVLIKENEQNSNNEEIKLQKLNKKVISFLPKKISEKISNIDKAQEGNILGSKRISRSSRMILPYSLAKKFSLEQLQTFENGMAVSLENNDYFDIQTNEDELSKYLLDNIGGNEKVSCIIVIHTNDGKSSSNNLRKIYKKIKQIIKNKKWKPIERINNNNHGKTYKGNNNWEGHYYINISGGDQDSIQSHEGKPKKYQIFNTYKGFMNPNVVIITQATLIYMFLHCENIEKYIKDHKIFKEQYSEYLKNIKLDKDIDGYDNIYDYCHDPCLRFINNDILQCPLLLKKINISQFEISETKDPEYLNICHNEAIDKKKIYFDKELNTLVSDYRPTNLFWGTHLGNMMQQSNTISEYEKYIKELASRFNSCNIYN
jgi:hypothetical protein